MKRHASTLVVVALCGLVAPSVTGCGPDSPVQLPTARHSTDMLALAAHEEGVWTTMSDLIDINPAHAVLLNEPITLAERESLGQPIGTVLVVSGSGNDVNQTVPQSQLWDFATGSVTSIDLPFDAFCSSITVPADGNPFIVGGNVYDNGLSEGLSDVTVFNVPNQEYRARDSMEHGRWYPTATLLGDGRIMVDAGWDEYGDTNETVEFFTPGVGWSESYPMGFDPMFYPRQHLLPDGRVFKSGPENITKMFDPAVVSQTNTGWTDVDWTNFASIPGQWNREYGTSVLLPLTPDNAYDPEVMILGGFKITPTETTELIDLGDASPTWRWGPDMSGARVRMHAILLPTGTVLALGGSSVDNNEPDAILTADLYDPATETFSPAGTMEYPHLDHSVALLLPDATVWVAGSQYEIPTYEQHMEIYQPRYLFEDDDTLATRPVIDSAPRTISYGADFLVTTGEAADIASVVLVRPGATTHMFNADQRLVGLEHRVVAMPGRLRVTGPPDSNIAPPGYYMLFLVDSDGVPSVATFVKLRM